MAKVQKSDLGSFQTLPRVALLILGHLESLIPRQDADTLQGLLDLEGPELVLGGLTEGPEAFRLWGFSSASLPRELRCEAVKRHACYGHHSWEDNPDLRWS